MNLPSQTPVALRLSLLGAAALVAFACEGDYMSTSAPKESAYFADAATTLAEPSLTSMRREAPPFAGGMARTQGQQGQQGQQSDRQKAATEQPVAPATSPQPNVASPSMIIRNGNVVVAIDSLEIAMEAVRALATRLGGYVGNVSVATGDYEVRSASLQMKIPAPRFDEAMSGMGGLGKVERSNATAEDVTEEFVDVTARVANGKRMEERLVALLAARTGTLEDALAVERELARVRQEVERLEGRIRFLSSRVATSTIDVYLHEKAPLVGRNPGKNVIAQAFVNAWRNFVSFIARGIESAGVLVPLVLVAYGLYRLIRRVARRRS